MAHRIPLLRKSPFRIDPRPLKEASSSRAGLLAVSRVLRSLGLPGLAEANLRLKSRKSGFTEAQMVEAVVLLGAAGGDSYEDMRLLEHDACLEKGLGYAPPKPGAVRAFMERFHVADPKPAAHSPQFAFIPEPGERLEDLARVNRGLVGRIHQAGEPVRHATVDVDATVLTAEKRDAKRAYTGERGYQPLVAVWAEADLVLADEFRDGNVAAATDPLPLVKEAFAAVPPGRASLAMRGDSACYNRRLMAWMDSPRREEEFGAPIRFAVSAPMCPELRAACLAAKAWTLIRTEADGTRRECAELDYVPSDGYESRDARPIRFLAVRLTKPQLEFFADGDSVKHFAVATNRTEPPAAVIEWHREKAGTVEHVFDEIKNHSAARVLPSGKFGACAAWFRLALIAYNVISALRALALEGDLRRAKVSTLRLHVFQMAGRMNRNNCVRTLRFCARPEQIGRIRRIWAVFDLPDQPTAHAA